MRYLSLIIISTLILASCTSITEPTLVDVKNVKVLDMNKDKVDITADMIFNNPNAFALDLAKANIVASIDSVEVSTITQEYDAIMPANEDFPMPVRITMDLKKLYQQDGLMAISKGLKIMSQRRLDVHFKGSIKVGKGGVKVSAPINKVETVKF